MKLELRIKKKSMHEQISENRFTHYLIKCQDCFKHNGLGHNAIQIIFLLKEGLDVASTPDNQSLPTPLILAYCRKDKNIGTK